MTSQFLGPHHASTLGATSLLAVGLHLSGKTREAAQLLGDALRTCDGVTGGMVVDELLAAQTTLAVLYRSLERPDLAIPLQKHVASQSEYRYGPTAADTLVALTNLGVSLEAAGQHELAAATLSDAVGRCRLTFGDDDMITMRARSCLATSYHSLGLFVEAARELEDVVVLRERLLPPGHPETLTAQGNLGLCYESLGRYEEALDMALEAASGWERLYGATHPRYLSAQRKVAHIRQSLGDHEAALTLAESVLLQHVDSRGEGDVDSLLARELLARIAWRANRGSVALQEQTTLVQHAEKYLDPDHPLKHRFNLALKELRQLMKLDPEGGPP
jgi:tetratricopeptide (TPR) repeat protein